MMNTRDRMLWMGDLEQYMDGNFIADAFRKVGEAVVSVRVIFDKYSGKEAGYCFVEMDSADSARRSMLNLNGKVIPNSKPPVKFNLSFANNPSAGATEYNLFVNNLPENVGDAELYQLFGKRYLSCRGAKVYRNYDGSSRSMGFVRFADETDQQKALVEMNRYHVHGRPMHLKLAPVRVKPPKYSRGSTSYDPSAFYPQFQDYYGGSPWQMYDFGSSSRKKNGSRQRGTTAQTVGHRTASYSDDPELEIYTDDKTVFQQNLDYVEEVDELFDALEDSRWLPPIYSSTVTMKEL